MLDKSPFYNPKSTRKLLLEILSKPQDSAVAKLLPSYLYQKALWAYDEHKIIRFEHEMFKFRS